MDFDLGNSVNTEIACASITPYIEFLINSRLKKFLFIVAAVLVFWLVFFCFLKDTESLFVRFQLDGRHDSTW